MTDTHIATHVTAALVVDIHVHRTRAVTQHNNMGTIIDPDIDIRKTINHYLNIALVTDINRGNVKAAKTQHTMTTTHQNIAMNVRYCERPRSQIRVYKHTMPRQQTCVKMLNNPSTRRPVMQDAEVNAVLELLH